MFLREPRIMFLREARIHLQVGSNCAVLACPREYVIWLHTGRAVVYLGPPPREDRYVKDFYLRD